MTSDDDDDSERFRFTKGGLFAWVEARGSTLVALQGRREEEDRLSPITERYLSKDEATEARDLLIAQLLGRGYERDSFGATAAARRARTMAPVLADASELETLVAEDPYDEAVWSVLEDWLLMQEDPRGQLTQLAREGHPEHEAKLRAEYMPVLFGRRQAAYERALRSSVWRGGYLLECAIDADPVPMLEAFLAIPAARLIRRIEIQNNYTENVMQAVARLLKVHPRSVRELRVGTNWTRGNTPATLDARQLVPLELVALGSGTPDIRLRDVAALPGLRTLEARENSVTGLRDLLTGTLPQLASLTLSLAQIEDAVTKRARPGLISELCAAIRPLAAFAPALRTLSLAGADEVVAAVKEELGNGRLGAQLEIVQLSLFSL